MERIEKKIRKAENGIVSSQMKRSEAEYIEEQKRLLMAAQRRISAFSEAKANIEAHDFIFFMFGKHVTEAFGKPLDVATVWITVRRAIAKASFALFKEAKWTNPHALRHIGEKHLRMIGKGDLADAFGALIGHSGKMGAEYAAQITTELEMTSDIVDNWWLE